MRGGTAQHGFTAQMTESFPDDFDTGRVLTSTGANGLTIHAYYDQPSLRLHVQSFRQAGT